ncbi:MAG: TerC family protein [Phycisphaerales bacterium]|nr:TerC family protein [Phycisphaerales bacterium]
MELLTIDNLVAFVTLSALEIVLGIDNVVYISILCGRLPESQRELARRWGLGLAMGIRILLLFGVGWLSRLTTPLASFSLLGHTLEPSVRDLVLGVGGLVLMIKAVLEMHHQVEAPHEDTIPLANRRGFAAILSQILLMDIVFSIDSVITAVGMANNLTIMIAAIVLSVGVMMLCSGAVARVIERHPTLKTLALSFLVLIGAALVLESVHIPFPKGAIYFTMAFSLVVEMVNIRMRRKTVPRST